MPYYFIRGLLLVSLCLITSCVTNVHTIKVDKDVSLEEDTGYLLLTVDTDFSYIKFTITGPQYVSLKAPDGYKGKNYYLVPVEAGEYRIYSFVNVWGLEYRFSEDEDKGLWAFTVRPGRISYIGDFKARRFFGRFSRFQLVNNASFALEYLEHKYPNILNNRKLTYEGPGEDFFYNLVRQGGNNNENN